MPLGWMGSRAVSSELGGPQQTPCFLMLRGRVAGTAPLPFWLLLKAVLSSGFIVPVLSDSLVL